MDTENKIQQKIRFTSKAKIDKIQLSIGKKHFKTMKDNCDKHLTFVDLKYIPKDDREIFQYRIGMLRVDLVRYAAKNPSSDPKKKIWTSLKMYNPTIEQQEFVLNNILYSIPTQRGCRHLTNIELALDIFPKNTRDLPAILRTLTSYATIKYARGDNIKAIGNSFKIGDSKDNASMILYPKPKEAPYQYVRIEMRLYNDSIPKLFKDNRHYIHPITEIDPLNYIVFRKHCNITKLRKTLSRKAKHATSTRDRVRIGYTASNLEKDILEGRIRKKRVINPVCKQLKYYRERLKRIKEAKIQDKTSRYFSIIYQMKEDIKNGFLLREY